jgi:hypothetical protein
MGRVSRVLVSLVASSALAACSALSGLDQIQESICVPTGCTDEAGVFARDSSPSPVPDSGSPSTWPDASAPADANQTFDATSPNDAGGTQDASARADVALDAPTSPDVADGAVTDDASRWDATPEGDAHAPAEAEAPDAADAGCPSVYFHDSFADNANGWTLDTNWEIARECAAPPAPQKGNPDPTSDHTGTPDSGVLGAFVCGNNPTGQTTPFLYATSPAVDVSGAGTLSLSFWRWLNTDASDWMASTVDVYDGATWVNVFTNPSGAGHLVTDAAWTQVVTDVTAHKSSAFKIRFGLSLVNAGTYAMSSWNVDDVSLTGKCP